MKSHSLLLDGGLVKGRSGKVSYIHILLQLIKRWFWYSFKPNLMLFMHTFSPLPHQTPSSMFHTFEMRKDLRSFLLAAIAAQVIFLE